MGMIFRLVSRLGLRWVIVSAIGRYLIRRYGRSTIERAGRDLESTARQRLPAPVANAIPTLPPEAVQLGGSAVVAGRAAKGAITTTRRAGRLAGDATARTANGVGAARAVIGRGRDTLDAARAQFSDEIDDSERRMRSDFLESTMGSDAATDALLDVRRFEASGAGEDPIDPHESVPDPVAAGRRRHRRLTAPLVNRVRRGYRPPVRPWD